MLKFKYGSLEATSDVFPAAWDLRQLQPRSISLGVNPSVYCCSPEPGDQQDSLYLKCFITRVPQLKQSLHRQFTIWRLLLVVLGLVYYIPFFPHDNFKAVSAALESTWKRSQACLRNLICVPAAYWRLWRCKAKLLCCSKCLLLKPDQNPAVEETCVGHQIAKRSFKIQSVLHWFDLDCSNLQAHLSWSCRICTSNQFIRYLQQEWS